MSPVVALTSRWFTPGTTTSLTLSTNYGSASNLWVAFDAAEQGADTYSLSGTTLTFNAPIPNGTNKVYVKGGTALTIGTLGANTVTDANVSANANIDSSKLSYLSGGAGAVRTMGGDGGGAGRARATGMRPERESVVLKCRSSRLRPGEWLGA